MANRPNGHRSTNIGVPIMSSGVSTSLSPAHVVARVCRASVSDAIAILSTPNGMSHWNLGLWNTRNADVTAGDEVIGSIVCGDSLFDGSIGYCGVSVRRAEGLVEYRIGRDPHALGAVRITARVTPGGPLGYDESCCLVALLAWRPRDMTDERWARLCATHETEIELLRSQLEQG